MIEIHPAFSQASIQHCSNHNKDKPGDYPESLNTTIDAATINEAIDVISKWPGYHPTPLHALESLASAVGVASIHYKDESQRFGLGSFKALGGAYAVQCLLKKKLAEKLGRQVSFDELKSGDYTQMIGDITVTSATDGNHGRSVAWGAQQFGCRCVIYIHAQVSQHREKAMQEFGAQVIRITGNYDESVHLAAKSAEKNGWFVISDTSYEGYTEPPRNVMAGYCVMMKEVLNQLDGKPSLTHVFVQGGVGGLAAAVTAYLWQHLGKTMPAVIIVEPELADCLFQSAVRRAPTVVDIEEETLMAGLSCGEVSQLAWQILENGASDFLTIDEDLVVPTMRLLANLDENIIAGESAIAGLAALIGASTQQKIVESLGINESSHILVLGTEGATDPEIYAHLTGINPSGISADG